MHPLLALFLMWVAHFMIDFMIGIFSVYKTLVQLDLATAGAIVFISALIGESLQILFGEMSDKGYRKALICTGLFLTCSSVLLAYHTDYYWVFALVLATYVGSGAFHPSAAGYVGTLSKHRRSFFISIFASGGALGLAFSQIGFYTTYHYLGNAVFLLIFPSLMLILALLPQNTGDMELRKIPEKKRFSIFNILSLFKHPDMRRLYLAQVCNQTLFWGLIFLLPDVLKTRGAPDWISFGGGHLALILGAALMMIPGGYLADRTSPRKVMLVAMASSTLLFYTFLIYFPTQPTLQLGMLLLVGAALGMVNPIGVALGTRLFPTKPGLVSAFLMGLVWCVAESLGPGSSGITVLFPPEDAPASTLMVIGCINLLGITQVYALSPATDEEAEEPLTALPSP